MITDGIIYLIALIFIISTILYTEKKTESKIFNYLPSIVIIYFIVMLFSTFGLWQKTDSITGVYKSLKSNLLPAMIFLMLLSADMREIFKLGKKMLLSFFLTSLSIGIGFITMFTIFHTYFKDNSWKPFAALCGSVPFAKKFNTWSRADTSIIDEVGERLSIKEKSKKPISFNSIFILLAVTTLISLLSQYIANTLPVTSFLTTTTWIVIIVTLFGILFAMTPLAKLSGSSTMANMTLYLIVALIASRANFTELTEAPLYIFAGFTIIIVHIFIMLLFAKIFKLDLFTLGVASLANIGGVASAPILASAYSKALIPIGVLMAMLGYVIGTFGGLMIGRVLEIIAN